MAAAAATRRAAASSMAGVDVASTSAQALLQAGLQQDIFARARSGATEAAASSQSSSSSLMSASCAGLTVSGILSVAQDTMPSPLRPPETSWHAASGLHNSGNWLTGSGNFQFGVSGAGFPFFPPLPETPAPDHGSHSTMHPPLPQLSMPPATPASTEQKGVWKQASSASSASAPSPSVPRTSVVRPQAMNNFYHCKADQRGEQAMAFWRLSSAELVQYNESFGTLLDVPAATLQDGYLWCNIQVVDQDMRIVTLQDEGSNALKAVQEFTGLVMAGTARYSQISFSFLSGRGRLKHMHVTMVAFHEDVLWICSEIGGDSSFRAPAPRRPQQAAQQVPSALSASGDSMPLLPPGPNDRKLVKVATRKKKPWDQNLVKFSLKKMRKRSKRKADQPL